MDEPKPQGFDNGMVFVGGIQFVHGVVDVHDSRPL
jgi:hypothetical protein